MSATTNYLIAMGIMILFLSSASIYLIIKYFQVKKMKVEMRNLANPKNDEERLELWDIQQKLTGPAGSLWFIGVAAAVVTGGVIMCIIAEIITSFRGVNW